MINEVLLETGQTFALIQINTRKGTVNIKVDMDDLPYAEELQRLVLYKDPKGRPMARSDKADGQVLLHRHLFDIPDAHRIEWINGDTLDLRRENIQFVDYKGNVTRLKEPVQPIDPNNTYQILKKLAAEGNTKAQKVIEGLEPSPEIKGVTFHRASQRWTSRPYWGSDRYSLGYFKTKEEAIAETLVFFAEGPDSPKLKRNQRKGN